MSNKRNNQPIERVEIVETVVTEPSAEAQERLVRDAYARRAAEEQQLQDHVREANARRVAAEQQLHQHAKEASAHRAAEEQQRQQKQQQERQQQQQQQQQQQHVPSTVRDASQVHRTTDEKHVPVSTTHEQTTVHRRSDEQPRPITSHRPVEKQPPTVVREAFDKQPRPAGTQRSRMPWLIPALVLTALLAGLHFANPGKLTSWIPDMNRDGALVETSKDDVPLCPLQPPPIKPATTIDWTSERKAHSAQLLSEAVQHDTQSYDDNGEPDEDPRWEPFEAFLDWWRGAFPIAVSKANVEMINKLGICATFEGSNPKLKPLVLMSHYDVVPAPENTWDRWKYPPFSGHNDGKNIWGRGSADDKTLLVAEWEAISYLLEEGWEPTRTIILTHGFDEEEVHARRGQGHIAPHLEKRYGRNGVLMVVDEGSGIDDDFYGATFALPAMGEKGYMDTRISIGADGGHSSGPPPHTSIGVLSEMIVALEQNPYPIELTKRSPFLATLACGAAHAPKFPPKWKDLLKKGPEGWKKLGVEIAQDDRKFAPLLHTTQAVDVLHAGSKVNSLPELAYAEINHRIAFDDSVEGVQKHIDSVIRPIAKKHGLSVNAWPKNSTVEPRSGEVTIATIGHTLEPAPNTPAQGGVWDTFAGTVRAVYKPAKGKEVTVAPSVIPANTDCKMYYKLTKNIFRFTGLRNGDTSGYHTVDEHTSIAGHRGVVDFLHALIQNVDAYDKE